MSKILNFLGSLKIYTVNIEMFSDQNMIFKSNKNNMLFQVNLTSMQLLALEEKWRGGEWASFLRMAAKSSVNGICDFLTLISKIGSSTYIGRKRTIFQYLSCKKSYIFI